MIKTATYAEILKLVQMLVAESKASESTINIMLHDLIRSVEKMPPPLKLFTENDKDRVERCPLDDVPLYVNSTEPYARVVAKWRLELGK